MPVILCEQGDARLYKVYRQKSTATKVAENITLTVDENSPELMIVHFEVDWLQREGTNLRRNRERNSRRQSCRG